MNNENEANNFNLHGKANRFLNEVNGKIQMTMYIWNIKRKRLHSSGMRTARALTVSPSMLCARGGICSGGVSAPGGGVSALGGFCSGGCLFPGGVSAPGGVPSPGWGGWSGTPPCGQTHACKHITLPQTSFAGGKYNVTPLVFYSV